MKEQDLLELGFEIQHAYAHETGYDEDFYYYRYTFAQHLQLLSSSSDEVKNNEWFVEFFDIEADIRFTNANDVNKLIILIEGAKK
jgi:hypothetical protein